MGADIHPSGVKSAGKAAHHVADTMVKPAHGELGSAEKDEGGAHLKGFASKASLDGLLDNWKPVTQGLQQNVHDTGDKLIDTANIYIAHDNAGVDLFKHVPWHDPHRPEPR